MSKVKPYLGFTDRSTVKLDLDNMQSPQVNEVVVRTMNWFKLGGSLILKSSKDCYHAVFDRKVTWAENVTIMAWVALQLFFTNPKVAKWVIMQCIKGASTLRVTSKGDKPSPRIVDKFDCQDHAIKDFLRHRQLIKQIHRSLH